MTVPTYVQNYWDAEWWMFLRFTVPVSMIAVIVAGLFLYLKDRYEDD